MSYSAYTSKIQTAVTNLTSAGSKVQEVSFDSSWEGPAATKQMANRTDLNTNLTNVIKDLENLAKALQEIDNFDTLKEQRDKWNETYNSIPSNEVERKQNALSQLNLARQRMREKRTSITTLLNGITTSYTSKLPIISQTEVDSTNNVFAGLYLVSSDIGQAFDIAQYVRVNYNDNPDFTNLSAWVTENPYSQSGLYGQCTWFAWGKFFEMYGFDPGFRGNGRDCAYQLVNAHPDLFEISNYPVTGAIFSFQGVPYGHVGAVTEVKDGMITYQDGNYDGVTNSFDVAKTDWRTRTMSVDEFIRKYGGRVVFANPKPKTYIV